MGTYCSEQLKHLLKNMKKCYQMTLSKAMPCYWCSAYANRSSIAISVVDQYQIRLVEYQAYLLDLTPLDYFLFHKMKHNPVGRHFDTDDDVTTTVDSCFDLINSIDCDCARIQAYGLKIGLLSLNTLNNQRAKFHECSCSLSMLGRELINHPSYIQMT